MTIPAEKIAVEKAADKPAEKPIEKRRALGRGLESLLGGPRVVTAPASDSTLAPRARTDGALALDGVHNPQEVRGQDAPSTSSGQALATASVTPALPEPGSVAEIQAVAARQTEDGHAVHDLPIGLIDHNPHQTRTDFPEEFLEELANSIRVQGVIQPIVVRPEGNGRYILILGERRLRASKMAGKATIPAIVKRVSEQQAAEMTVVENLQREDLHCLEQAGAFAHLSREFSLTQDEIGKRVGVSRETVSNYLRLLRLPGQVLHYLRQGDLTYSHARELLALHDETQVLRVAQKVVKEKMSVVLLEELVLDINLPLERRPEDRAGGARWVDPNVRAAQRQLETVLGMRVRIRDRKGKGKITIEYSSLEDFDRVVGMLKGK
ncbi:MAG: ParB/RepB/Spo0J family partition protein [Acidobacteriia bacterium]|nr:ParB/RepB/Spo0J family partition protein [Terriglobia bacterium]